MAMASVRAAEDPVSSVQRSLRHLGFYYAEPTGKVDEETRSAIKRFQIRNDLKITGETDIETLQALTRAAAANPRPIDTTAPAPSVRERAAGTEIGDREFLQTLRASDDSHAPVDAPVRPAPIAEPPPPAQPPSPPQPRTVARPARPPSPPDRPSDELPPAKAAGFVQNYLRAAQGPRPDEEISFFADHVDYFDSGRVPRRFVAQDQISYYRRWPNREFTLVGAPQVVSSDGHRATVRFRMRYKVSNGPDRASGITENVLRLQQEDDRLKIIGIQERKTRD